MQIKNRFTDKVIFENDADTLRQTVLDAIKSGANLSGANLSGAYLTDAYLSDADLRGADLRGADLSGANLSGAYLTDAYLSGANLRGAYLRASIGIFSFGPIGETGRIGYAVDSADGVMFALGCFWGNEKEAIIAIRAKYGEKSLYETQVKLAAKIVRVARNG